MPIFTPASKPKNNYLLNMPMLARKKLENMPAPVKKKKVRIGKLIKILSGGRHALYESNVGIIRKPLKV